MGVCPRVGAKAGIKATYGVDFSNSFATTVTVIPLIIVISAKAYRHPRGSGDTHMRLGISRELIVMK